MATFYSIILLYKKFPCIIYGGIERFHSIQYRGKKDSPVYNTGESFIPLYSIQGNYSPVRISFWIPTLIFNQTRIHKLRNVFWGSRYWNFCLRPARPRLVHWARIQFCGVLNQQNHGNQPKTMKNHETTLKNHGNQPKTIKNQPNRRHQPGDPTDLLWSKNVTSLTGGSNWPFRCLDSSHHGLNMDNKRIIERSAGSWLEVERKIF